MASLHYREKMVDKHCLGSIKKIYKKHFLVCAQFAARALDSSDSNIMTNQLSSLFLFSPLVLSPFVQVHFIQLSLSHLCA